MICPSDRRLHGYYRRLKDYVITDYRDYNRRLHGLQFGLHRLTITIEDYNTDYRIRKEYKTSLLPFRGRGHATTTYTKAASLRSSQRKHN